MTKLLIFPYNGNGLEAVDALGTQFDLIGFIDDTPEKIGKQKNGLIVFGREAIDRYPDAKIIAVPGCPSNYLTRKEIIDSLKIPRSRFTSVIHPHARISPLSKIGHNVLIMAGVVVTSNAIIGNNVCLLPNTVIHHDCRIKDYTLVGSNVSLAGRVTVGRNCYVGSGASIINDATIGNNTLIGIGSNVINPIKANVKAAGNPARIIGKTKI